MASVSFVGGPLDGRSILNTVNPLQVSDHAGGYYFDALRGEYVWIDCDSDIVHIRPEIDETTTR